MNFRKLSADLTAGLTVSFAAISLGAAFGILSGRGAFAGMLAAAVIPIIASLFGGTRIQASGPTAPMTAISAVIVAFAYDAFPDRILAEQFITLVFLLNSLFLIVAGITGLGQLIKLVPNVVILGFMNGIAVLIWADQFNKIFAIGDQQIMKGGIWLNLGIALLSFGLIFLIVWGVKKLQIRPPIKSFISGVLWSIIITSLLVSLFRWDVKTVTLGSSLDSLSDFKTMVVNYFPTLEILSWHNLALATPYALQLTLLAYLDSLLTALVVDRLTYEKSKLNKELVAQGLANSTISLLQGIPGAQATIRSVLLIKEGAQTRFAGILIGIFALALLLLLKDYLVLIPAAVFVGVLLKVGLDVADRDFLHMYFKQRWFVSKARNVQLFFILYTTIMTVVVNLNVAVLSGTVLFYLTSYLWSFRDVETDLGEFGNEAQKKHLHANIRRHLPKKHIRSENSSNHQIFRKEKEEIA